MEAKKVVFFAARRKEKSGCDGNKKRRCEEKARQVDAARKSIQQGLFPGKTLLH